MKNLMALLATATLAVASTLMLPACGSGEDPSRRVVVYMYSEYIDPKIPEEFEKATGIKVRIDTYENSEDMRAKLQRGGGDSQYDVVVVSDVTVPSLVKLGLIRPLEKDKLPNVRNVDARFANPPYDEGSRYTLPYQWGTVGLMYDKTKVPGEVSWALLFDEKKQPGKFILMDSMRDMLGVALKYQGKSMNSKNEADVQAAGDLLLAAKKTPNCLGFEGGVGGKNRVVDGSAAAAVVYNGDAVRDLDKNKNAAFAVPVEGGILWTDVMVITSKAPNADGAHKFVNYILDARVGAQLSNFNRYATPNVASLPLITTEDRENIAIYPSDEQISRMEYLVDLGKETTIYDKVWTGVKAR